MRYELKKDDAFLLPFLILNELSIGISSEVIISVVELIDIWGKS